MSLKNRPLNPVDWTLIASTIHTGMAQLQQEDTCTDFAVEIGEQSFRCHKVVLASVSDYFKALFSSGMKEIEQSKVVLDDVSPESFQIIMKILYPDGQTNPLDNVQELEMSDLLKLAGRFQMKILLDISLKYYTRTMSVRNCIARWKLGDEIMCKELSELGFGFITDHFEEMANVDGILVSLEFEDFHSIVKNESMHVKREDIVWSSIQEWISFDKEKRCIYIDDLLRECSLTQIDPDFLVEEIAFDPIVRQSDKASRLVQEAVKYKRHPGMHGDLELKFRDCHEKRQAMFLLLRDTEITTEKTLTVKDVLKGLVVCSGKAWQVRVDRLLNDNFGRSSLSSCVHGESVYVLNENKHRRSKLVEYNSSDNSWECQRDMDLSLVGHSLCAADGCLYVIGGRSTLQMNAQVWQYSIDSNSWTIDGEILAPVVNASSACVDNKIYIFGGELDKNEPANCVQMYDTDKKTGTIISNLPKPFGWSRALVRGKIAYVVTSGGDVVKVSLESGESTILASIPNFERVNFGICLQRYELYIFGGHDNYSDEDLDEENTAKNPTKGDFSVDISTGEVKRSKWLHKAGYRKDCEVLASVSVVLDTSNLEPIKEKAQSKCTAVERIQVRKH